MPSRSTSVASYLSLENKTTNHELLPVTYLHHRLIAIVTSFTLCIQSLAYGNPLRHSCPPKYSLRQRPWAIATERIIRPTWLNIHSNTHWLFHAYIVHSLSLTHTLFLAAFELNRLNTSPSPLSVFSNSLAILFVSKDLAARGGNPSLEVRSTSHILGDSARSAFSFSQIISYDRQWSLERAPRPGIIINGNIFLRGS